MSVTSRRLLLVDASGFVFRAYHAIGPLSTSAGVTTHAVLGFTRMILKLLREEQPTHLVLAFDKDSRRGRQEIDPEYKAHRPPPPSDLVEQFVRVREVAEVLGLPSLEVPGWEADDIIATLTRTALAEGWSVRIVTGDKDFIQLLDEGVELYDPMKDQVTVAADVPGRLGIEASQMRDYLALMGDAIDNIPKVPGVGPKTAADLLKTFGDVETLIGRLDEVAKPKLRETLREHVERVRQNQTLVGFRDDLELGVTLDDLAIRSVETERARALFTELEFYRLLQELPGMARVETPAAPAEPEPDAAIFTEEALTAFCGLARSQGQVGVFGHVENGELVGLGLGLPDAEPAYLPLGHRSLLAGESLPRQKVVSLLEPLLGDAAITKVGHGLKALSHALHRFGLPLEGTCEDLELLAYLHNPSRREHALADLSRERLHRELSVPEVGRKLPALVDRTVAELAGPAVSAVRAILALRPLLWRELDQAGLSDLARELELPLLPVLARMERRGILVDVPTLTALSKRVDAECLRREQEIHELAGETFNVGSNQQLAKILFDKEKLALPVLKKGKTGPSADQEVLEKLSAMHPLPRAIIDYRSVVKLKSTYLDTLPKLVDAGGRIHTTFHQAVAATGRLSSSDPNLQNIPIRTELGREIRAAFVAPEGMRLISADYSQVELRILAHVTGDPGLLEAFRQGADIHTRTAAEIFAVPESEVNAEMRRVAKTVNFGIAYGLSAHGLSTRLDIPQEEARDIIRRYFERYPGIQAYLKSTVEEARRVGYVETLFGRRRPMADLHSKNRMIAQGAERAAINMPIQGTAADLIKKAMLAVEQALTDAKLSARMLLQVHDELVFEAPLDEVERVTELARTCMGGVAELAVPLEVEVGVGGNWSQAH
ncbi:MAG TPA: DNA polymerase I [Myxococcaceae bacterium]|nr:DNA polymerase I [Myxococcaceae bacterium]